MLPFCELARIGRGSDCTVVVDDPRVSRSHAAIRPAQPYAVTDLGSINGTFVGQERLRPGVVRALAAGETFFVGDSALAMRPSGLSAPARERILTVEQLPAYLEAAPEDARGAGTVLLRVRATRTSDDRWLPVVLGDLLSGARDWLLRGAGPGVVLGIRASSRADAVSLERDALSRLGGWAITATAETVFVSGAATGDTVDGVTSLLRGGTDVRLQRGAIVIRDPAMQALRESVARVAKVQVNLLVLGETGVGKDIVASMAHEMSPRADQPFVRLNCASLPEALMENELFGHERGAFTGADGARVGLLEAAHGGTVFLDEIGDLALPLQAKLLIVIETGEIMRLGGVRPRRIDVRFVAATNRPLDKDIEAGRFRRDLFHRLNGVSVTVPPLRERRGEIEPLARAFLGSACARFGLPPAELSAEAVEALLAHAWPGNVRELRNVIERAVLLAGETILKAAHLGFPPGDAAAVDSQSAGAKISHEVVAHEPRGGAALSGPELERAAIEEALVRCGGNQSRAAQVLGIPRRTLVRRIAQLGLPRPRDDG